VSYFYVIKEDPEALDIELDENLEMLGMRTGELTGERLLCEHYLGVRNGDIYMGINHAI
jgi:hypothetical protein